MRAAGGLLSNGLAAVRAQPLRRGGLLLLFAAEAVDSLDQHKDHDRDQQKVDHRRDKGAIGDLRRVLSLSKGDG